MLQVIGVTLFGTPATNRGGITVNGAGSRLAIYSSVLEFNGKGSDDGGALILDAARGFVGSGVVFRNNTSNSGNGGAVRAARRALSGVRG